LKGVTPEVIAEVRGRANLLEVISEFVVLKRAGKEHRGLCPFHSEKSPSFHVNPEKGIFKCFGCGEGGDVFAFVQKIKKLEFIDSVRDLAHRYGVQLVETVEDKADYDRRTGILMLYQQAAEFYTRILSDPREGMIARDYLKRRGVSDEIIAQFKLGYAPNAWDGLLRYLSTATKVSQSTLEEAGLVRRRPDSNSCYDLFRNRLMIPIFDDQGRVIAFGGRTLGDDQVKYLNSPETPIYTKGQHLFGLHLARESIKQRDCVIVVEGYFDAITAHQYGFEQTVATLGTALTERQAKLLVRYTESKRVYLAFDADTAGERALERGVETLNLIAEGVGIELRALRVPGGKDPDECLRSDGACGGPAAFEAAITAAPLLVYYQLERAIEKIDLKTHTGRIEAAKQIVPILAQIKNSVGRGEYIRQWALRLGIREEELLSDVGQYRRRQGMGLAPRSQSASPALKPGVLKSGHLEAERQLLALYLTSREDHRVVSSALADEVLIEPVHQRIKDALDGIGSQFDTAEDLQYKLMDRLAPDGEAAGVMVDLVLKVEEIRKQKAPVGVMLNEGRARVLKERLIRAKNQLRGLMGLAGSENEQNALSSKISQLLQLESSTLLSARTEDEINDVRRKISEILSDKGQFKQLETTA
jgi:DNA primase